MSELSRIVKGVPTGDYVPDVYTPRDVYPPTWQGSWVEAARVRLELQSWYKRTSIAHAIEAKLIHVKGVGL